MVKRTYKNALALVLLIFMVSCAAKYQKPTVIIAPAEPLPVYEFTYNPDGSACLDTVQYTQYKAWRDAVWARLTYLKQLLLDMGAKEKPQ